MFETFVDPTIGSPDEGSVDSSSAPGELEGSAAEAGATGGETPGEAQSREPIPYDRFEQVVRQRQTLEQQISQFQPYEPLIQSLRQAGVTDAYQALQYLQQAAAPSPFAQQQQQPASPEQQFTQFAAERGVDLDYADEASKVALRIAYDSQQQVAQLQEFYREQERQTLETQLQSEMAQAAQKYPFLQNPTFQRAVYSTFALISEQNPQVTLAQVADQVARDMDQHVRGELARYSAGKAADAQVPNVAGGMAPPPTQSLGLYDKGVTREERQGRIAELIRASRSQA